MPPARASTAPGRLLIGDDTRKPRRVDHLFEQIIGRTERGEMINRKIADCWSFIGGLRIGKVLVVLCRHFAIVMQVLS